MDALTLVGFFVGGFIICAVLSVVAFKMLIDLHRDDRDIHVAERDQWRSERRELINRVQHPNLVPTGTAPVARPVDPRAVEARRAWAQVGRVVPGNGATAGPDDPTMELP